jgi:uncharacterized membrane protein
MFISQVLRCFFLVVTFILCVSMLRHLESLRNLLTAFYDNWIAAFFIVCFQFGSISSYAATHSRTGGTFDSSLTAGSFRFTAFVSPSFSFSCILLVSHKSIGIITRRISFSMKDKQKENEKNH